MVCFPKYDFRALRNYLCKQELRFHQTWLQKNPDRMVHRVGQGHLAFTYNSFDLSDSLLRSVKSKRIARIQRKVTLHDFRKGSLQQCMSGQKSNPKSATFRLATRTTASMFHRLRLPLKLCGWAKTAGQIIRKART